MAKKPTKAQIEEYLEIFDTINKNFDNMELEEVEELLEKKEAFEEKFDTECVQFEVDDKVGLKDFTGRVIIPAEYDDCWSCNFDLLGSFNLAVKKDGKYAIISSDGKGELLTGFDFDAIEYDGDMFICEKGGKFCLLNEVGQEMLPAVMDGIESLSDELVVFEKDGKFGFLYMDAETGETKTIEAEYDSFEEQPSLEIAVVKDGIQGYVDKDGAFTQDKQAAWLKIFQNDDEQMLFN